MSNPSDNDNKGQWYVVQVLSGQEKKVSENILSRIAPEEMSDFVYKVLVPTRREAEVKGKKRRERDSKIFPGYIIINMRLLDDERNVIDHVWYFIRNTNGVIGFAGTKTRPVPMPHAEVEALLAQMVESEEQVAPKIPFTVGESVKVADGAFLGQMGIVEEINTDTGMILVSINMFGRSTPVDLEYWQVEKE